MLSGREKENKLKMLTFLKKKNPQKCGLCKQRTAVMSLDLPLTPPMEPWSRSRTQQSRQQVSLELLLARLRARCRGAAHR